MSDKRLEHWSYVNAAVALTATAIVLFLPSATAIVPLFAAASLASIWIRQDTLRLADAITGLRGIGGLVAFALCFTGRYGSVLYIAVLAAAEAMDFFDGLAARKHGGSEFGALWDMETDAFFILLLSISAWRFGGFGMWAVIPGLLRYVFLFMFMVIKPVPISSAILSWFMKTVCVVAVVGLIAANASSLFSDGFRLFSIVLALGSLGVSFVWETVYYVTHREATR